jgi:glycosyltransferase involved in cell wall biosynthesis
MNIIKKISENDKTNKEIKLKKNPLITIITVVFNNKKFLEKTIKSVLSQSYQNIEYIIIDGGSTDGTLEIIKKYNKKISFWISEKDYGIYDAFNKGLKYATGDLIGFVNSDDILLKDASEYLVKYYRNHSDADFFFGSVKKHWGILHGYKPWKIKFTWGFYTSHSTGFFIKKKLVKLVGMYNIKYKYSADYDYFYRLIVKKKMKGVASKKNEVFGIFRRGGFSSRVNFLDHLFECTRIRLDNNQNKFMVLLTFIFKFICNLKRL